jgi:hypothetical protein
MGAIWQFQRAADESMDLLANGTSAQRVAHSTAKGLELQQQVEVTELQNPSTLIGDLLHARKVVDYHRLDSWQRLRRNSRDRLLPTGSSFLAWQEQRIEESGSARFAGLESRQIQHPRHAIELEPQTVGQKDKRPTRDLLGARPGNEAPKRLPEPVPIGRQFHSGPFGKELTEREAVDKNSA